MPGPTAWSCSSARSRSCATKGYAVENVDAVIVTEVPKIAPHVDRIRATLAGALGVGVDAVSVKGKTNEGMGEAGRGEGMFVHAVALLKLPCNFSSSTDLGLSIAASTC